MQPASPGAPQACWLLAARPEEVRRRLAACLLPVHWRLPLPVESWVRRREGEVSSRSARQTGSTRRVRIQHPARDTGQQRRRLVQGVQRLTGCHSPAQPKKAHVFMSSLLWCPNRGRCRGSSILESMRLGGPTWAGACDMPVANGAVGVGRVAVLQGGREEGGAGLQPDERAASGQERHAGTSLGVQAGVPHDSVCRCTPPCLDPLVLRQGCLRP